MVYDIFNFLTGYVYIKIEGVRLERVLNSGITFWNVKRTGYSCIYASVSYAAYKKLLKEQSLNITLIEEHGIFSLFKRLWENKILFIGLCICVLGLVVMSNMVVGVEVNGYYSISKEEIETYIREWGAKPFVFKQSLDLDGLCSYLKTKDNIAWASAGYDGVVLNVEIIEQVNEFDNTPCDIVAGRQAVIKKIDVYAGIKNKQEGDVVNKGEILVAGIAQTESEVKRIKARADVIGTIWESGSYTLEAAGLTIYNTGNSIQERYIDFWGNKGYIKKADNNFEHYVVTEKSEQLGGIAGVLPIKYVTLTYNEVEVTYDNSNINALTEQAGVMAFETVAAKVPQNGKIIASEITYEINQGQITANALIEVELHIGENAPVD